MPVRVVGINLSHDSSVCLVEDGVIRVALALERTVGVKRGTVPLHLYAIAMTDLIDDILSYAQLNSNDVDYWIATSTESRDESDEARLARLIGLLVPPGRSLQLPHPGHHLAHASSAFYTSGFEEAAALVIDAYGSLRGIGRERETAFHFRAGCTPQPVFRAFRESARTAGHRRGNDIWIPAELSGIGEIYRVVTLVLGFQESGTVYDDAGKTMGLASYGKRISRENLFIGMAPDGELTFDRAAQSLLDMGLAVRDGEELRLKPHLARTPFEQFHYDLAAQVQAEFEDAALHLTREVLRRTRSRSLVAAGGCFLNSALNTRLLRETEIDRLFVFPAATDDGNAAGAALYAFHNLIGQPAVVKPPLTHVYLGPSRLAGTDPEAIAKQWGLQARRHTTKSQLAHAAASAISRGEIVGWFEDRAEYGPRALGARSILCHPGIPGMKDRLNARVKFREAFRPFAGSVLAEQADKWFDMPTPESPFMLLVCAVLPGKRDQISEIVHVDGTCRVQTVNQENPPPFRDLIEAFETITGLPLVLNTSFNVRGKPIVERPEEAVDCLYGSRLDRLFVGEFEIEAPDFAALCPIRAGVVSAQRVGLQPLEEPLVGSPREPARQIIDLADGTRSMGDIADAIGIDSDEAVDVALDLRRHGLLRWTDVPEVPHPHYPPVQYWPSMAT